MRSILVAGARPHDEGGVLAEAAAELASRTGARTLHAGLEEPDEVLERAHETGAELLVLSPRLPRASSAVDLEPAVTELAARAPTAVLLVRPPFEGEIRRVLIPIRRDDLERGTLAPALAWAARLCPPGEEEPAIHVLHVARSPDEMQADRPLLRREIARCGVRGVRRFACVRWGASPHLRILRWISRHGADLVVLRRDGLDRLPGAAEHTWFGVLGAADCPVLLLPQERPGGVPAPVPGRVRSGTGSPRGPAGGGRG